MSSKRIEQGIEDILDYIDSCKHKSFSTSLIVVNKDELYERVDELKLRIPEEIQRCQKIIERKDDILRVAEENARKIIESAQTQAQAMVSESEVIRNAYSQANDFIARTNDEAANVLRNASDEAEQIKTGAYVYAKDMLDQIAEILQNTLVDTKGRFETLVESLSNNYEIVEANRRELCEEIAPEVETDDVEEPAPEGTEGGEGEGFEVLGNNDDYGTY